MDTKQAMPWKLRAVIYVLGLLSTAGSAIVQEGMLLRVAFLLAAAIWAIALGFLVKERLGRRREG